MNTEAAPFDPVRRHRLTNADYHRMGDAGILGPDARVELIDGEIIDMPPIGSTHSSVVNRLTRLLVSTVGDRAIVSVQNPIVLPEHSEPEPDFALLRPREDFYENTTAHASDVLLVIEVADSTLRYDTEIKMPLYARHGIAEAWLIDARRGQLTVFTDIVDGAYRRTGVVADPRALAPISIPDIRLDLSSVA